MKLTKLLAVMAILPAMIGMAHLAPANADAGRAQAQANFQAADVNQDEVLDPTEFRTFINLNADHNLGRAAMIRRFGMHGKAFGQLDANGYGVMTPAEIASMAGR